MPDAIGLIQALHQRVGDVRDVLREAGDAILDVYANEFAVTIKADKSPVTEADTRSSDIVSDGLLALFPNVPVLSEENQDIDYATRRNWKNYWLLDPLDGTKEFIKRNGEFCINAALMINNQPVAGFIYIPLQRTLYHAIGTGEVVRTDADNSTNAFSARAFDKKETLVIASSRSHGNAKEIEAITKIKAAGYNLGHVNSGSAIKFCLIAEGKAHMYFRYGPTSEWDTAAGHALLRAVGGDVMGIESRASLAYNKEQLLNPAFAALGPSVYELMDYVL
ncbi:MAG TPA: 3'(2'),5'-bisphosphate nucleotidase CysQ [Chitinophagales bacterium]|nr:3'(2'),5'-bisphosphate nucleotidase CysQ [Chitinophagales bacterium]